MEVITCSYVTATTLNKDLQLGGYVETVLEDIVEQQVTNYNPSFVVSFPRLFQEHPGGDGWLHVEMVAKRKRTYSLGNKVEIDFPQDYSDERDDLIKDIKKGVATITTPNLIIKSKSVTLDELPTITVKYKDRELVVTEKFEICLTIRIQLTK